MSKSKIPGEMPAEKKPEVERDPDDVGDRHEPEIPAVPDPQQPDIEPTPDKPEVDTPAEREAASPR